MIALEGFLVQCSIMLLLLPTFINVHGHKSIPIVISTWNFTRATEAGWESIIAPGGTALDAIVSGCSQCERDQCDGTVGFGGSPDENGESTLDAMIMDGSTMDVGAVANLRDVKDASKVARMVLEHTEHTLLVGSLATQFALSMGFERSNLSSDVSIKMWEQWKKDDCQPNFWKNVSPDPRKQCGPYKPISPVAGNEQWRKASNVVDRFNHDTVGAVAIDSLGNVAAGTSTNGAKFKIPGRVGDSPVVGSGAYADNEVGGAASTGDGDLMMRFSPSFHAVELMRMGVNPTKASQIVISRIAKSYSKFFGGVISVSKNGDFGAACHGMAAFPFTVMTPSFDSVRTFLVPCIG